MGIVLSVTATAYARNPKTISGVPVEKGGLAVIKGVVRNEGGDPIADATVAIFRAGTSSLLKQVQSEADGSFFARIAPGTYSVLAVAQGYNPVTLSDVEILQSAQLVYGFKLERAGSGNTLPEKRIDRNNPKWVRRSSVLSRSIYQNNEGDGPETAVKAEPDENTSTERKGQSIAETYFSGTDQGSYAGLNFATFLPVNESTDLVFLGQTGTGNIAPQRLEARVTFRPSDKHQLRGNVAFGKLGKIKDLTYGPSTLSQFNLSATDEWRVREGVILVFGLDYAQFVGAGSDSSLTPRLGLQYDLDARTRLSSAFTTQNTDQRDWSRTIELENAQVVFREPFSVEDLAIENGKPVMNRSSRFEIGIERVLDNQSNLSANFFADAIYDRGVGLVTSTALENSDATLPDRFVANQQGNTKGFTLVYNRRFNGFVSASAGYSAGIGLRLSEKAISNPANLFAYGLFQTFFGQLDTDLRTGTNIKTVFRLSPEAAVFAIDPFQGRLAIFDPSLSVLVTQSLPSWGLPIQAQAVVDARNIFDLHNGINGEDGSLRLNNRGRALKGSILVRF